MKKKVIFLAGPTAVGKTALSIDLAKQLNTSIISGDSVQVYKYMDIGSAKVTTEEMDGVKHYLIDEVNPDFEFSVSEFQQRAFKYMNEIWSQGKIPIIAGGTGLYLNSLLYEMDFNESNADSKLRDELWKEYEEIGAELLHKKLESLDPAAATRIHPNNVKRVIRAIEVNLTQGNMSDFANDMKKNEEIEPLIFILNRDRETLYANINLRVDKMFEAGLLKEVEKLLQMGYNENMISMKAIGYKETVGYLRGEYSLDRAMEIIKQESRRYAKRQLTWFKRYQEAHWVDLDIYDTKKKALDYMFEIINREF